MRKLTATICLYSFVTIGGLSVSANGNPFPLQIEETRFFVQLFTPSGGQSEVSQDFYTTIVPLVPKRVCYGWRIKVPSSIKLIKFREEFSVPTEPTRWSGENNEFATNKIIDKRRTSVTIRFTTPDKGWVENAWCVLKGDPEGNHSMKVYFNDQFIKEFYFEVRRLPTKGYKSRD